MVGHANGEIVLWEFKRTGWEAVKALKDAHTAMVTSAAFLESSSQLAISGDAKGRLVLHNVTAYLSITSIFAGQSFPQSKHRPLLCVLGHSCVMHCVLRYALTVCKILCHDSFTQKSWAHHATETSEHGCALSAWLCT